MTEIWIANASPIIVLAKIEKLDLLLAGDRSLLIPEAVAREILEAPAQDPARRILESGWGSKPVSITPHPDVLEWGLGAGESAVLSLAREQNGVALVDDRAARIACKALGITYIGTLGIVLRSRLKGQISSSVEILKALRQVGLHLDDHVIQTALLKVTVTAITNPTP